MMFWNKLLFVTKIAKVSLTIDGIYYVLDHRFGKYTMKHDRNMQTETKASTKKLQNMKETYKSTQDNIKYRTNVSIERFYIMKSLFLILFYSNERFIIHTLNINSVLNHHILEQGIAHQYCKGTTYN
jgi:hypothetical protein